MIRALVPFAEGSEELETVALVDTLRRAGWDVVLAGVAPGVLRGSRGTRIEPDAAWDEIDPSGFDLLAVPGGQPGTDTLRRDERLLAAVRGLLDAECTVAAVCAAPLVLQEAGVLKGRRVTSHPAVRNELAEVEWVDEPVVADGRVVTSQGAGTTIALGLKLIECLGGGALRDQVAEGMRVPARS